MKEVKFGAIIEARMGSTRLPGKSLIDLCGEPLIKRVIDRIKCSNNIEKIILATTTNRKDDILEDFANKESIECFRRSEENVLERVLFAAKYYNIKNIVELHGDNPFLDANIIDQAINRYNESNCDYISNTIKKTYPMGLRVQIFSKKNLTFVYENVDDPAVEEHVSNYFYENPDKYSILNMEATDEIKRPEIRLTIDTIQDIDLARSIYKILIKKKLYPNFSTLEMLQVIDENNIHLINKDVITKPLR